MRAYVFFTMYKCRFHNRIFKCLLIKRVQIYGLQIKKTLFVSIKILLMHKKYANKIPHVSIIFPLFLLCLWLAIMKYYQIYFV